MEKPGSPTLLYAAYIRLPTEKAHGVQIVHTCAALARAGVAVKLTVPGRKSAIQSDPFSYYGIENNFELATLPVPDMLHLGRLGFLFSAIIFAVRCSREARRSHIGAVYTRDRSIALVFSFLLPKRIKLFFEAHGEEPIFLIKALARRAGFVGITSGVREMLVARGAEAERTIVAHDAVALEEFAHAQDKKAARERLGLQHDKKIVMYVGRLDGWKGAQVLLEASKLLPPGVEVALIGGEAGQIEKLKSMYPRAHFLGYHLYRELAGNLAAADVLALPNTARDTTSLRYTSPLKLFAYMAARKPIVASDIPSLREVLTDDSAFFAAPDDSASFAKAVEEALSNPEEAARLAARAQEEVRRYTWDARAQILKNFITTFIS